MAPIFAVNTVMTKPIGHLIKLCKVPKNYNVTQVAFMKRLALKEKLPKPPAFPYWKKKCTETSMVGDFTSLRFDENSRLIVVDGPPGIGKTKFCKKLAEEFGLLYMPPPTHDEIYMLPHGFNMKQLDPQLPPACRTYDLKQFLENPNHMQVPQFQLEYFFMRLEQYLNALIHLLASGQGVILNRSFYSEISFTYAMCEAGYLRKEELMEFEEMRAVGMSQVLRPHLAIYLQAPPEVILKKIKERGNPDELNSKVFTTKYFSDFDKAIKERYLPLLMPHSELLIYNWSKEGNYQDVIHDIECLDLEPENEKEKFSEWVFLNTRELVLRLAELYNKYDILWNVKCCGDFTAAPRLYHVKPDIDAMIDVIENTKETMYDSSYNIHCGEKVMFTREKSDGLSIIRNTPKDFIYCDIHKTAY